MEELPETIRIGGIDYEVVEIHDLRDGDTGLNGWIRYNEAQIRIEANMAPVMKLTTVWHEVVHGILEQAGIGNHEEHAVEALGYGIVQALRDNPYLRGS